MALQRVEADRQGGKLGGETLRARVAVERTEDTKRARLAQMLKPTGAKRLLGRRRSPPVGDINLARDDGPLGHDKPWCNDVANDRACRSNVELLPGYHVAHHRTANRDVLCEYVRFNRGARSDGQAMVADFDRSLHVTVNRQIFSADDLALDSDRSSNPPSPSAFIKQCARIRRKPWSHSFARAIPVPHPVSPFRMSAGHRRMVDSTGLLSMRTVGCQAAPSNVRVESGERGTDPHLTLLPDGERVPFAARGTVYGP